MSLPDSTRCSSPFQAPYVCTRCPFKSYTRVQLNAHFCDTPFRSHLSLRLRSCCRCSFRSYSRLLRFFHAKVCEKKRKYTCLQCNSKFKKSISLKAHSLCFHRINEWIECDQCNYQTKNAACMNTHLLIHIPINAAKYWNCLHCSYTSKIRSNLMRHIKSIHEIAPKWFACAQCDYKTKYNADLKKHKIFKHNNNNELIEVKLFECGHCSLYKCKSKGDLRRHIIVKHTRLEEINWHHCDHCDMKYKCPRDLRKHKLLKHISDDLVVWYKCHYCPHKGKLKSNVKKHISTAHQGREIIIDSNNL